MATGKQLAERMIRYFRTAEDLPSFVRFAEACGIRYTALLAKKEKSPALALAFRECEAILRDRLTAGALLKQYDGSFVKFLLSEDGRDGSDGGDAFTLRIRVVDEGDPP